MNATLSPGLAYDATSILGFGSASDEPLPEPAPGEVVIHYGGWSLQELRNSDVGKKLMHEQDWYNKYAWSTEKLPPGLYRLRVPVPDSNPKTFAEQQAMLSPGEQVAPVVLVATALLVHYAKTGEDLLKSDWTRCKEQAADGNRVALYWDEGRLGVSRSWGDGCYDYVWLSSVRTS
jgi:hypothetical protein